MTPAHAMTPAARQQVIETYRHRLETYGSGPEVGAWSAEGQRFRFEKLTRVGNLSGQRILDVGCGLGDFYPFLTARFGTLSYTGIDIVADLVERAAATHAGARFECGDVLAGGLAGTFDYVFISGLFNCAVPATPAFLEDVAAKAFSHASKALAFNFISTHVNSVDAGMNYHDPVRVLAFCLQHLSRKVEMHHHYERCDVSVFVYR